MKKRFYLVRHGEKVKQIGDPPLSKYLVFPGQYQNYKAVIDHLVPKSNLIK